MKKNILIPVITLLLVCTSCAAKNASVTTTPTQDSDTASSQVAIASSLTSAASTVSSQPAVSSVPAASSKKSSPIVKKTPSAVSTAKKAPSASVSSKPPEVFPMAKPTYNGVSSEKVFEKPLTYTCYPPDPISGDEFTHMLNTGDILISTLNSRYVYKPKNQQATLTKIVGWLKQSTPYTKGIPDPVEVPMPRSGGGGPFLVIHVPGAEDMTILPVFYYSLIENGHGQVVDWNAGYMQNVLEININEKKGYITSSELYNWLVNANSGFESECNETSN